MQGRFDTTHYSLISLNKCNIQQTRNVFFMQGRFDTTHTHKYHNKCNIQQTRNVFFMQARFDTTHYS